MDSYPYKRFSLYRNKTGINSSFGHLITAEELHQIPRTDTVWKTLLYPDKLVSLFDGDYLITEDLQLAKFNGYTEDGEKEFLPNSGKNEKLKFKYNPDTVIRF